MSGGTKNWSARFAQPLNEQVARFNASVGFDYRLAAYDIRASIAHVQMLAAQGIISKGDGEQIVSGLQRIGEEVAAGQFQWEIAYEDVHFNIEARLIELVGEIGKKVHTARSRNDQVATDLRLYLRDAVDALRAAVGKMRGALLALAADHCETLLPGFTHLQVAQPVVFAHHLLAYDDMLCRDDARLADARVRLNRLPLGAGALAGVGYPVNRESVATALGFDGVCENSLDAVSDRDFAVEYAAAAAMLMVHLSRFCEELVLWSNPAFAFVELPDAFCTGSSIMPQKKNPDVPELIRGKCGRVIGALNALLVLGKSQPLAYNKDNQEDKEPLFDCVDTAQTCVEMLALLLPEMRIDAAAMRRLLDKGYPTATELADYLTQKGMPFRTAHGVVSAIVRDAAKDERALESFSVAALQSYVDAAGGGIQLDDDVLAVLDPHTAVARRNHTGGTAPEQVRQQIRTRQRALS